MPVVLRDIEQARVDEALATVREEVGAKKPFLATLIDGGTGWEQFEGCDLVLEAVFEQLDVKREVFAEVRAGRPRSDPRRPTRRRSPSRRWAPTSACTSSTPSR